MKNFVKLKITSTEMTANEICSALGLEVDHQWSIGDFRGKTKLEEKCNGCFIESDLDREEELTVHVNNVLDRLEGKESNFQALNGKANILLSCAAYCEEQPELYFDKAIIKKLSLLNTDFDIDIYHLD